MQKGKLDMVQEMIKENLGDSSITLSDLTRISFPSGKSTTWVIPDIEAEGGTIESKAINGIILMTQRTRQYWVTSYDDTGGGTPPDCSSEDGVTGRGNPSGDCNDCNFSQFDSTTGRQECQEKTFALHDYRGRHPAYHGISSANITEKCQKISPRSNIQTTICPQCLL